MNTYVICPDILWSIFEFLTPYQLEKMRNVSKEFNEICRTFISKVEFVSVGGMYKFCGSLYLPHIDIKLLDKYFVSHIRYDTNFEYNKDRYQRFEEKYDEFAPIPTIKNHYVVTKKYADEHDEYDPDYVRSNSLRVSDKNKPLDPNAKRLFIYDDLGNIHISVFPRLDNILLVHADFYYYSHNTKDGRLVFERDFYGDEFTDPCQCPEDSEEDCDCSIMHDVYRDTKGLAQRGSPAAYIFECMYNETRRFPSKFMKQTYKKMTFYCNYLVLLAEEDDYWLHTISRKGGLNIRPSRNFDNNYIVTSDSGDATSIIDFVLFIKKIGRLNVFDYLSPLVSKIIVDPIERSLVFVLTFP